MKHCKKELVDREAEPETVAAGTHLDCRRRVIVLKPQIHLRGRMPPLPSIAL